MTMPTESNEQTSLFPNETTQTHWFQWVSIVIMVYLLLVAVSMIGAGFQTAAGNQVKELFTFASNPIIGLVIGTIATAIVQSSSTVTSIIVGLVAGGLPIEIAIPLVMGANIGTTVTNTIVSIGHATHDNAFKRAFAAATIHDFFNLLNVIIFLPLEIMFGFLEKASAFLAGHLMGGDSLSIKGFNFIKPVVKPPLELMEKALCDLVHPTVAGIVMVIIGVIMIFTVISVISKLLKRLMVGRAKAVMQKAVGRGPISGLASGTLLTVMVQSSSTTTSLVIPLAGSGVFSLRQIYPFTLGANIGTCITALLAATAVLGVNAVLSLQIALVHFLYNVMGVIIIYGIPVLRNIPLWCAEQLAHLVQKRKKYAIIYMFSVFFILPALMIVMSKILGW